MSFTYESELSQEQLFLKHVYKNRANTKILNNNEMVYWLPSEYNEILFVCFDDKQRIAGMLGVQPSGYKNQEDLMWFKFVCVHDRHKNKGIASHLIDLAFDYCSRNNKSLLNSSYHREGPLYLPMVFARTCAKYPNVEFFEANEQYESGSRYNLKYSSRSNSTELSL